MGLSCHPSRDMRTELEDDIPLIKGRCRPSRRKKNFCLPYERRGEIDNNNLAQQVSLTSRILVRRSGV